MSPTNDDITLVITCFNYGEYLADAVDSALGQVGGPPRVTVVDDGSTAPATLAALDRLPAGVSLIRQPNAGLSAARNTGLRAARTPFLIVLDADDLLPPTALRDLRAPLDQDPKIGFSYGITRFFGEWEGELTFPPYDPYRLIYRHIIGSTALMRREVFERVGGYDPEFAGYEDWDFWVSALSCGWRGEKINTVTFLYRRHGTSTMISRARAEYRRWFRRLRHKHAHLYSRDGRRWLASESALSPFGRFVYRWWWGARPMPARMEWALHSFLWRPRSGSSSDAATGAIRVP
jgi:GT2 family glycosyltransferase